MKTTTNVFQLLLLYATTSTGIAKVYIAAIISTKLNRGMCPLTT